MKGQNCKECECSHSTHYHAKQKPVKKTKAVEEVLQDMKDRYDQSTNSQADLRNKIAGLSTDIATVQQVLKKKEAEIQNAVKHLKASA